MAKKKPQSIQEFIRAQRRTECKVCRLPQEIRDAMFEARQIARIRVTVLLEWLASEYDVKLTRSDVRLHYGGLHEPRANKAAAYKL